MKSKKENSKEVEVDDAFLKVFCGDKRITPAQTTTESEEMSRMYQILTESEYNALACEISGLFGAMLGKISELQKKMRAEHEAIKHSKSADMSTFLTKIDPGF